MTPLFPPKCGHPAIKAAKQCKKAMELSNMRQYDRAEALLRNALGGLRRAPLPMVKAKILNSLGLVYAQQQRADKAERCFKISLRIVDKHIGRCNWLYERIADNLTRLS
jgi:tetratricopeptide (TPR) repeat protein